MKSPKLIFLAVGLIVLLVAAKYYGGGQATLLTLILGSALLIKLGNYVKLFKLPSWTQTLLTWAIILSAIGLLLVWKQPKLQKIIDTEKTEYTAKQKALATAKSRPKKKRAYINWLDTETGYAKTYPVTINRDNKTGEVEFFFHKGDKRDLYFHGNIGSAGRNQVKKINNGEWKNESGYAGVFYLTFKDLGDTIATGRANPGRVRWEEVNVSPKTGKTGFTYQYEITLFYQ